ncbi:hypothetical protein BLS_008550 [Venturia inaequalis]|uniref:Uncharacterized protein n=1 Tax=Venturia inaequalis TaxID=5025 RepID=A0A8H3Z4R4_VENIN|nr:hypothetical protein BLS_008550 [Venturia inaequalis]
MGAIGQLVPLVLLFAFVGVFAYFGYQMYVFSNDLADRGVKKMEKKNIFIGKDGAKVGVKEVRTEDYEDKTQKYCPRKHMESRLLPRIQEQDMELRGDTGFQEECATERVEVEFECK